MREWAHRLWSSSVNSGAMTSQSTSAEHDRNTSGRAAIVLATSARSDARVDMGIKVSSTLRASLTAGQSRFCERSPCPGWAAVGAGAPVCGWVHARDSIRARRPVSVEAPDGAGGLDHSAGPPAARALSVTFSFNKLPNLFWLAASVDSAGPIHLARRVDPDTTPRTSIADVVPDRARALGVDQGAGIHRPPGRRPRAWWTCRHRVSARNA